VDEVLVCGLNWVGDGIMSMPALQAFRRMNPTTRVIMLVKPKVAALWRLHAVPDRLIELRAGMRGTVRAARAVGDSQVRRAYVLPHSFRSALVPYLARVPERIGFPGHGRDWMLTEVRRQVADAARRHQAWEYMGLLAPESAASGGLEYPALEIGGAIRQRAEALLEGLDEPRVGLVPGAGRGPSKRWPAEHFIELGRLLRAGIGAGIAVPGAPGEERLCRQVAQGIGRGARSLAGRGGLDLFAALLQSCRAAVANDSGGAHVAAAVGTPVVVIFGVTDPEVTGPLGRVVEVVRTPGGVGRDVPRDSLEARRRLALIQPETVYRRLERVIERAGVH